MKEILNSIKPKKMSKEEIGDILFDYQNEIVDFYVKKAHHKKNENILNLLYEKMANKKFPKALKYIIKSDDMDLDIGFVLIINGFIERSHRNEELDPEILDAYSDIMVKLLKDRVKEVEKKSGLDKDTCRELLFILPEKDYISAEKYVSIYSQRMLRKLYLLSKNGKCGLEDTKQVGKMFKSLFNKNLIDVIAVNILLEKKEFIKGFNEEQQRVWNLMTTFALEVIEKQDKDHVKELIEYYISRRAADQKRDRDAARRIQLTTLDPESYPKISKVVAKLTKKNENFAKFL